MTTTYGTLLVLGSGPGVGRNVAQLFASRGFQQVVLLSRNAERLEEDAAFVKKAASGVQVHNVPTDLGDRNSLDKSLAQVDKLLKSHPLQAVCYNAARVGVSKFFEWSVEKLESDLAIAVTSLYATAAWAIPHLQKLAQSSPSSKPAFLVTSGLLYEEPFPHLFSLSTCKAAQFNLVYSLYKEFGPKGVHCATVVIGGVVHDNAKVTTAAKIAEEFWSMYTQEKGNWQPSVKILDPDYDAMSRGRERSGEVW